MRASRSVIGSTSTVARIASRRSVRPRHHAAMTGAGAVTGSRCAPAPPKQSQHPRVAPLQRDARRCRASPPRSRRAPPGLLRCWRPRELCGNGFELRRGQPGRSQLVQQAAERLVVAEEARGFRDGGGEIAPVYAAGASLEPPKIRVVDGNAQLRHARFFPGCERALQEPALTQLGPRPFSSTHSHARRAPAGPPPDRFPPGPPLAAGGWQANRPCPRKWGAGARRRGDRPARETLAPSGFSP